MVPMTTTYEQKITFGEMRASGVRGVLIYCRDHRCSHHVEANADGWKWSLVSEFILHLKDQDS